MQRGDTLMARYEMELPTEIMQDIQRINDNYDEIFGGMTEAGAKVVYSNICANVPKGIKESGMMGTLKISRVYKTPSDDGINTKVLFAGYFTNKDGVTTPAPLVANVFEYGRSNAPLPKQPFLRKAFRKGQIEKAMQEAQKALSGGLLE